MKKLMVCALSVWIAAFALTLSSLAYVYFNKTPGSQDQQVVVQSA